MTGPEWAAGVLQVAGVALAPLLPGTVQTVKARLQGRQGPTPFQPYRELRRLWGKSVVEPEGATLVYRLAPAVAAAAVATSLLLPPLGGVSPGWPVGHDALLLVGLLVLARFVVAAAAWDTGGGFSLMGAARDLTFSVFVEGLLALSLVLVALPVASTDLRALSQGGAGSSIWSEPAHWCVALVFWLVVLAETGRQPIDNPDTHLELTMVHEGPLLEYAGRDLAYLQWVAAARHWIVLVLTAELVLPHGGSAWWRLAETAAWLPALCVALALTETWQAKLRILRVPRLLLAGMAIGVTGLVSWFVGGA